MRTSAIRSLTPAIAAVFAAAPRPVIADVFTGAPGASTIIFGRYVTQSVPVVLASIAKQTGLRLAVDQPAGDLPVTLIFHNRRASDVLSSLASFLDFTWVRRPEGYLLVQLPEQADRHRNALREVMAPIPALVHAYAARKARHEVSDPNVNDVSRLGFKILRDIGVEGIARVMEGDDELFAWPTRPGCLQIPDSALQEWRSEPVTVRPGEWDPRRAKSIIMRCTLSLGYMTPRLTCALHALAYESSGATGRPVLMSSFGLAGGLDYSGYVAPVIAGSGRRAGFETPAWMAEEVALDLADTVDLSRSEPLNHAPTTYLLGDALAELDRVKSVDVIADAFAAPQVFGVHIGPRAMADALDELARMATAEWWVEGRFLMLRHSQRALRRASEPPHQMVHHLRGRLARNDWTIDDSAQLAMLPTPRYESIWFPANPPLLPHDLHMKRYERDALALWRSLTPAQRSMAEDDGVPYAALNAAQKDQFCRFVNALDCSPIVALNTATGDDLSAAVLRVTLQPGQAFRHRRGLWSIAGVDREQALTYFRLYDAATTDGDLIVGSRPVYWLRITSGDRTLNSVSIAMPIVWPE